MPSPSLSDNAFRIETLSPRRPAGLTMRARALLRSSWERVQRFRIDPVLAAALVVGALVRAWRFGALPSGMNQDEAAMAYDAYCLIHHGTDRLGIHLPTMLVSWGSGMNPLASYVAAPFVGLLGLRPWTARLPFLLAGVASLPLFYTMLRETIDRRVARVGVALLAISPWHVMVSRWGLEANLFPFVFLLASVLLLCSTRRPSLLLAAAAAYAISLYAYGTSYFVVPTFVVMALAYGLRHRLWPARFILAAGVVFVLCAIPMGLNLAVNSLGWNEIHTPLFTVPKMTGTARYRMMGNTNLLSRAFLENAADNLKAAAGIFRAQDDGLISNVVPGYGVLFWFTSALAIAGLALLAAQALRRRYRPAFFLLAWSLAAILMTAFVSVNVNRANIAWLPFIACASIATAFLGQRRSLVVLLGLAYGGSFVGFVCTYFGQYAELGASRFFPSFGEAIGYASRQTEGEVCITKQPEQPYIFVLLYNREDPRTFYRTVRYEDPHADFHTVVSFGRYRFGLDRCRDSAPVLIVPRQEAAPFEAAGFEARRFSHYTVLTRRK